LTLQENLIGESIGETEERIRKRYLELKNDVQDLCERIGVVCWRLLGCGPKMKNKKL
jgi:hypothetical protein